MILKYLSAIWAASAPALGNHLWQSTLCLVIAGLLALILRRNHARARYGLWLAASVKFLIPFSLLVGIGSHLASPRALPQTQSGFIFAMEEVSQPFTKATTGTQPAEKSRRPAQDAGLRYSLVFTAVQEQLGLKLESQKGSVEILMIDHVEKPSEN